MNVAILGFGTVGSGAYEVIQKGNTGIRVKRILDIKVKEGFEDLITTNFDDIINDTEIDIVAEVMGGLHPAYEYVKRALMAGKHVVTANKKLISHYYKELNELARANNLQLKFTPSAGGGIPWLYNLKREKRDNRIEKVSGILNGTTNFILDAMYNQGKDFEVVLHEAQRLGYAEADPTDDIDGLDVQRKCAISASIAFDETVLEDNVNLFGMRNVKSEDIEYFKGLGKVLKFFAVASKKDGKISAYVEPTLFEMTELESAVNSNFNLVSLYGDSVGRLSFFGQGAGKLPTGSALVSDMIDISQNVLNNDYLYKEAMVDNDIPVHNYYIKVDKNTNLDFLQEYVEQVLEKDDNLFIITKPMSVLKMHEVAENLEDKKAFIAGFANN